MSAPRIDQINVVVGEVEAAAQFAQPVGRLRAIHRRPAWDERYRVWKV